MTINTALTNDVHRLLIKAANAVVLYVACDAVSLLIEEAFQQGCLSLTKFLFC